MFISDLVNLDFRQCDELPQNTIVAPLMVIREIRCLLGNINIDLVVGTEEAVFASSDVFEAFNAWDAMQNDEFEDGSDNSLLN